ncbi:MAG: hypothetical protein HN855_10355 [Anaerolineae bacterium]|jgi:hypothetical protein|nr:hypothetical protein [Anaerolineae bacterium]MBT7071871.1 hypothetical protein [Anaerolineae bacterium]MBT7325553.1 hypothetical protein [Anaerolineae bacterium]
MYKDTLSLSENYRIWSQAQEMPRVSLLQQSAVFGAIIGEIAGAIIGTATGFLTMNLTGILLGFTAGVILGALTGLLTGIIVGKIAGTSGGPSVGAYAGMAFGTFLGAITGLFIPETIRASIHALQVPALSALALSRFEMVSLFAFLLCILGTLVGVWVAGKNYAVK